MAERWEALLTAKTAALASSVGRGHSADDVKSASGEIYKACKRILELTGVGNDSKAFMRDTLTALITPETQTYATLRADIFEGDAG